MLVFRFLFDLLLLPLRLYRRRLPKDTWLKVTIDEQVVDIAPRPRFWQRRRTLSLHALAEAADDPRFAGIVVVLRSFKSGMATATSLRAILERAREAGREVIVHLPLGAESKEVYIATAASKILLGPTAQLAPFGFRSASPYVKRALEKLGLEPQIFARGEFKSAGENLMRDSMSAEQRAQSERLLDSFYEALIDAIARGRNVDREKARAMIDGAPYFGSEAVVAGLADGIAYEDEVFAKKRTLDLAEVPSRRLFRALRRPVIAVVPVHGTIGHTSGIFGQLSTDERVTRMVRAMRRSRRVKGVILHIDSPGGSAIASDLMHHEIAQLAREKPLVACMANVAASGGYYVAAPAKVIVAQPTTITGSIGVVAARFSAAPLFAKLGITTETVTRGARAELLAPTGPLSEDGRATILREIDAMYRSFVRVVAAGRKKTEDEIEPLARGRVYTGTDARDVGLVDVLGGFDVAIAEMKKLLPQRTYDVTLARPPRGAQLPLELPSPQEGDETPRSLFMLASSAGVNGY